MGTSPSTISMQGRRPESHFTAHLKKLKGYWRHYGSVRTLKFLAKRVIRRRQFVLYDSLIEDVRAPSTWADSQKLLVISKDNLSSELSPTLLEALGGDSATEYLDGIRSGDLLFVVMEGRQYVHFGFVLFDSKTTQILGEGRRVPIIANCFTSPEARGRSLYRNALNEEVRYLRTRNYRRVLIETHPQNYSSRRGIEAAGFRFLRELDVVVFLNSLVLQRAKQGSGHTWRLVFLH
jgi:hypothetical protein